MAHYSLLHTVAFIFVNFLVIFVFIYTPLAGKRRRSAIKNICVSCCFCSKIFLSLYTQ